VSDPIATDPQRALEPVHAEEQQSTEGRWTVRLVFFLRLMAGLSILKGLPLQTATVFFAVIDLVAAVGLWLAAAWGAVVWLTAAVSMAAVEVFFPQVYGGRMFVVVIEGVLLFIYLFLAIQSAREHPQ
jgi:hypothetical protein